MKLNEPAQDDF
jgi:hypothetical protein